MCIYCNLTDTFDGIECVSEFMDAFYQANIKMRQAEKAMLEVAKHTTPEQARRYRRFHKAMVKQRRAWNSLEQIREYHLPELTHA